MMMNWKKIAKIVAGIFVALLMIAILLDWVILDFGKGLPILVLFLMYTGIFGVTFVCMHTFKQINKYSLVVCAIGILIATTYMVIRAFTIMFPFGCEWIMYAGCCLTLLMLTYSNENKTELIPQTVSAVRV